MGLPSFSLRKPVFTIMLFLAIVLLGIISLIRLPVELYQGQSQGIVSIIVQARGGLPPVEVEKRITKPIEEAVATVEHLKSLYSHSREAESRVTMEFEPGTNMKFAALEIREKFSRVRPLLPQEIEKPVIANYDDSDAAILIFALTSETMDSEAIRELVETELKPILSRVDGVASIEVYGGRSRKILVELDRDKMVAYNISIEKVMDIIGQSNVNLLAGNLDKGKFEYSVRSMGAFTTIEEIGNLGIQATRQGSIIPLKEIATVKDAYLEPEDYARLNLEQNVTVYVKKTSVANTIPMVKTVRLVLDEFKIAYEKNLDIVIVADKAETISRAIGDVRNALFIGMFLAVLVIYVFLRQPILAFIVLISIPCSVIATFVFMDFLGVSLNVMTLSGLALAIGILVDSAVVILENIFSKKEKGYSDKRSIQEGSEEVWFPLLGSLITTVIVFLPVIFIDKKIQLTYAGFAFTVCISLITSFFVALMLVPVLIQKMAQGRIQIKQNVILKNFFQNSWQATIQLIQRLNPLMRGFLGVGVLSFFALLIWSGGILKIPVFNSLLVYSLMILIFGLLVVILIPGVYTAAINWTLSLKFTTRFLLIFILTGAFIFSGYKIMKKDIDWPSTLEENEFSVIIFPLAGARLEANDDAIKRVENVLSKIPDVDVFSSTIRKDDVRIFVRLKPKPQRQFSKEEIMTLLDQKGNELIKEVHDDYTLIIDEGASSSEQKKLVINIFGLENDVLQKLAASFADKFSKIPGFSNLVMTDLRKRPEYSLVVDKGRAAVYGLTVKDVADSVHAQVRGMRPTKFHELQTGEEIETITRLQAIYRQKIEDLKFVHIATDSGIQIPIGEIANFYPSVGPQTIDRKDKYRYVFVKGDTKRPLESIARDVKEALKDVKMPDEYYWRFGGSYNELIAGKSELSLALILTIFLVYMVLACLFQNYLQPFLVMISIPMASIGIWIGLAVTNRPLSQHVFIGMILLAGYVVNAAIIMIDHFNSLVQQGVGLKQALIQSGHDRLRPILMTTLSTTCGFLPMAINWGQSSDLWSPLAITVMGGLLSSTFLTLFVLPAFLLMAEEITVSFKSWACFLSEMMVALKKHLSFGK